MANVDNATNAKDIAPHAAWPFRKNITVTATSNDERTKDRLL